MVASRKSVSVRLSVEDEQVVRRALEQMGATGHRALERIEKASAPASRGLQALNVAAKNSEAAMRGYAARLGPVGEVMQVMGKGGLAAAAGIAAVGVAAVGLARVGAAAVRTAADFEQAMAEVRAVTNATGKDFEALTQLARDMGAATQYSAREAADGIKFLGQAGFSTSDIMKALPATLTLAAAGSLNLGQAANIASNVLSGMRLQVGQLNAVVDLLAYTASHSKPSVSDLGEAFGRVAPFAAAAGVPINDVAAALGVLGDNAIQGSEGGTALSASLRTILRPSTEAAALIKQLGLSFFDASGQMRPLVDIIGQLEVKNITARQGLVLFGEEGGRAINALVGAGSKRLKELREGIEGAGGAAERMARIQMDTLNGALRELDSAAQELQIAFGAELLEPIREFAQVLRNLAQDENVKEWIRDVGKGLADIAKAAQDLKGANLGEWLYRFHAKNSPIPLPDIQFRQGLVPNAQPFDPSKITPFSAASGGPGTGAAPPQASSLAASVRIEDTLVPAVERGVTDFFNDLGTRLGNNTIFDQLDKLGTQAAQYGRTLSGTGVKSLSEPKLAQGLIQPKFSGFGDAEAAGLNAAADAEQALEDALVELVRATDEATRKQQELTYAYWAIGRTVTDNVLPALSPFVDGLGRLASGDTLGGALTLTNAVIASFKEGISPAEEYARVIGQITQATQQGIISALSSGTAYSEEILGLQRALIDPLFDAFERVQQQSREGSDLRQGLFGDIKELSRQAAGDSRALGRELFEALLDAGYQSIGQYEQELSLAFGVDSFGAIAEILPRIFAVDDAFQRLNDTLDDTADQGRDARYSLEAMRVRAEASQRFTGNQHQDALVLQQLIETLDAYTYLSGLDGGSRAPGTSGGGGGGGGGGGTGGGGGGSVGGAVVAPAHVTDAADIIDLTGMTRIELDWADVFLFGAKIHPQSWDDIVDGIDALPRIDVDWADAVSLGDPIDLSPEDIIAIPSASEFDAFWRSPNGLAGHLITDSGLHAVLNQFLLNLRGTPGLRAAPGPGDFVRLPSSDSFDEWWRATGGLGNRIITDTGVHAVLDGVEENFRDDTTLRANLEAGWFVALPETGDFDEWWRSVGSLGNRIISDTGVHAVLDGIEDNFRDDTTLRVNLLPQWFVTLPETQAFDAWWRSVGSLGNRIVSDTGVHAVLDQIENNFRDDTTLRATLKPEWFVVLPSMEEFDSWWRALGSIGNRIISDTGVHAALDQVEINFRDDTSLRANLQAGWFVALPTQANFDNYFGTTLEPALTGGISARLAHIAVEIAAGGPLLTLLPSALVAVDLAPENRPAIPGGNAAAQLMALVNLDFLNNYSAANPNASAALTIDPAAFLAVGETRVQIGTEGETDAQRLSHLIDLSPLLRLALGVGERMVINPSDLFEFSPPSEASRLSVSAGSLVTVTADNLLNYDRLLIADGGLTDQVDELVRRAFRLPIRKDIGEIMAIRPFNFINYDRMLLYDDGIPFQVAELARRSKNMITRNLGDFVSLDPSLTLELNPSDLQVTGFNLGDLATVVDADWGFRLQVMDTMREGLEAVQTGLQGADPTSRVQVALSDLINITQGSFADQLRTMINQAVSYALQPSLATRGA